MQRAFRRLPEKITAHARAFAEGMVKSGIVPVLEHFPGHGSALGDTHRGFVDISRTWSEQELIPYRRLLAEGFGGAIMSSHVCLANREPTGQAFRKEKALRQTGTAVSLPPAKRACRAGNWAGRVLSSPTTCR